MMQGLTQQEAKNRLRQDGKTNSQKPPNPNPSGCSSANFGMSWL